MSRQPLHFFRNPAWESKLVVLGVKLATGLVPFLLLRRALATPSVGRMHSLVQIA